MLALIQKLWRKPAPVVVVEGPLQYDEPEPYKPHPFAHRMEHPAYRYYAAKTGSYGFGLLDMSPERWVEFVYEFARQELRNTLKANADIVWKRRYFNGFPARNGRPGARMTLTAEGWLVH